MTFNDYYNATGYSTFNPIVGLITKHYPAITEGKALSMIKEAYYSDIPDGVVYKQLMAFIEDYMSTV